MWIRISKLPRHWQSQARATANIAQCQPRNSKDAEPYTWLCVLLSYSFSHQPINNVHLADPLVVKMPRIFSQDDLGIVVIDQP